MTTIENALNDINVNTFNDLGLNVYENQLNAAKDVIKAFCLETSERRNWVNLVAPMQSGKTGVCTAFVNIFEMPEIGHWFLGKFDILSKPSRKQPTYFFISGMNLTELNEQTKKRIKDDVYGAEDNVGNSMEHRFFVGKNSDLRKIINEKEPSLENLENCFIFIDESHFGSKENDKLTKFLEDIAENGWKNGPELESKNIYIISISATPFDELRSDVAEIKPIVKLIPGESYVGVPEFKSNDCIFHSNKNDFKPFREFKKSEKEKAENIFYIEDLYKKSKRFFGKPVTPIELYIEDAYETMQETKGLSQSHNGSGMIIIRTFENKSFFEKKSWIKENFQIIEINSKEGIEIKKLEDTAKKCRRVIQDQIEIKDGDHLPKIILIKGAWTAGVTFEEYVKEQIYMTYEPPSKKGETTLQGLLGRMCGYRNKFVEQFYLKIYANDKNVEKFLNWQDDPREDNPSTNPENFNFLTVDDFKTNEFENCRLWLQKQFDDVTLPFAISLSDEEIIKIANFGRISRRQKILDFIKEKGYDLSFYHMGENFTSGKNKKNYNERSIASWIEDYDTRGAGSPHSYKWKIKKPNNLEEMQEIFEAYKNIYFAHFALDASLDDDGQVLHDGSPNVLKAYLFKLVKQEKIKKTNIVTPHKNTKDV